MFVLSVEPVSDEKNPAGRQGFQKTSRFEGVSQTTGCYFENSVRGNDRNNLMSTKQPGQSHNTGKSRHRPGRYAPAGFLINIIHEKGPFLSP